MYMLRGTHRASNSPSNTKPVILPIAWKTVSSLGCTQTLCSSIS